MRPRPGWLDRACCWSRLVASTWCCAGLGPRGCGVHASPVTPRSGSARPRRSRCCVPTRAGGGSAAACATPGRRPPGAHDPRHPVDAARPASGARVTTRCARRAAATGRPAGSPSARRTARPRRAAGLARGARRAARAAAVRRPAGTCPPSSPGCASSTAGRRCWCAGRAPSSTRCASTSSATTCARIDWRATARATTVVVPHLAARARPPHLLLVLDTGAPPPAGSATPRASTPPWTPRCCSPRWPPGPATGSTCWPYDRRVRAARRGREPDHGARRLVTAMAPLEPGLVEADWRRRWPARCCAGPRSARWSCCSPPLDPAAIEEACCPCWRR